MLYVTNANIDTKGMVYPRALQHTTVGCYLLIICMIGLFAIGTAQDKRALGPMILMIICGVFTVIYHLSLNQAITPLLNYLPKNLETERDRLLPHAHAHHETGAGAHVADEEKGIANGATASEPVLPKANPIVKFFQPYKYADYETLGKLVPHDFADISYSPEIERHAYYHPCISASPPLLWIPRDPAGVSRQEVAHTSKVIPITDEDAFIDDTGKITWNEEKGVPPIYEEKIYY